MYSEKGLLNKLYNRELYGKFIRNKNVNDCPAKQLFHEIPERLVFDFRKTIPNIGNHILMGATRCGQMLLTYTYSNASLDTYGLYSPPEKFRYRLHFWSYRPGMAATKVAEVQLFDNCLILDMLTIGIVYWPNVNDRVLVYGQCYGLNADDVDGYYSEEELKTTVYITVTTIPSLENCKNCRKVAESFDEEEMAANWDSGVGLTCLKHGLTFHTWYTNPSQHFFIPEISAILNHSVLINTGSFIHVLRFDLEHSCEDGDCKNTEEQLISLGNITEKTSTEKIKTNSSIKICNEITINRLCYTFLKNNGYNMFFNESWICNLTQRFVELSEQGHRINFKEVPWFIKNAVQNHLQVHNIVCHMLKKTKKKLSCSWLVMNNLTEKRKIPIRNFSPSKNKIKRCSNNDIDKVYDFDEQMDDSCVPKFKLFRRRCLADKMYEFRADDEEMDIENIRPLIIKDRRKNIFVYDESLENEEILVQLKLNDTLEVINMEQQPESIVDENIKNKKDDINDVEVVVTENQLNEDNEIINLILSDWDTWDSQKPEVDTRHSVVSKFLKGLTNSPIKKCSQSVQDKQFYNNDCILKRPLKQQNFNDNFYISISDILKKKDIEKFFGHQTVKGCFVNFTRRYIENDEEIISTITEIEDDELGTGFQCALPLSVHGAAYSQMEMISNQKIEKLNISCAVVTQSSLDIENLSSMVAERICCMEGYKFWFISDYDCDIVQTCPKTGDILLILYLRLNAEDLRSSTDEEIQTAIKQIRADSLRNAYESKCLLIWSRDTYCYLEGYTKLFKSSGQNIAKNSKARTNELNELKNESIGGLTKCSNINTNECCCHSDFKGVYWNIYKPIRTLLHNIKDGDRRIYSFNNILDHDNLIGFKRHKTSST